MLTVIIAGVAATAAAAAVVVVVVAAAVVPFTVHQPHLTNLPSQKKQKMMNKKHCNYAAKEPWYFSPAYKKLK